MRIPVAKLVFSAVLLCVSHAALAAAGTPIGGVIVKGGKNPGGQMHVLATTDAAGRFKVTFTEGGDYTLEFVARASEGSDARIGTGMQVDYAFRALREPPVESRAKAAEVSRPTPFHNKIENNQTVITVPPGGGEISGMLQSMSPSVEQPAERSINESGVSVKSSTKKPGVKH